MKRLFFFATPADVTALLHRFEAAGLIKYTQIAGQTSAHFAEYHCVDHIPNPGISTHETGGQSQSYLVTDRDQQLKIAVFVETNGNHRWYLNNGDNEGSIVLTMAGLWKDMILPGKVDTLHDTKEAQQLMKRFSRAIKAEKFTKNNMFWLGREALAMLESGVRLSSTAEQSPPEYDLKLIN